MLRTRLFLNLVPFVVILLAVGIYAIVLFSRLADNVDLVVVKNYQAVVLAQSMELSAAKMHSGMMLSVQNPQSPMRQMFEENHREFVTNLTTQITNVLSTIERSSTDKVVQNLEVLQLVAPQILESADLETRTRLYTEQFIPALKQISANLQTLREVNHYAILRTKAAASRSVQEVTRLMILGMLIALVLASYACYQLGRAILTPIQDLTRASQLLGQADLKNPVPVHSADELGQLAKAFNAMAAQLHQYRQNTSDRIIRLHRTMETALASFPDPIFVLDKAGGIDLKNASASALIYELGAKLSLPAKLQELANRVVQEDQDYLPNSFDAVVHLTVKGTEKFYLPRVVRMHGDGNELVGVALVLYDVTRFRLLDDAKSNLVATVSHELKTPLTGIRMALHLLAESLSGLNAMQKDLVMTARNDTERLLRILNDLLDLTKLEEGKPGLQLELSEPGALVDDAVTQFRDVVRAKGLEIRGETMEPLPMLKVDRQRLTHVFSNLINNAIKYSPPGGTILVRAATEEGGAVHFSVVDEGPGVADQHKHRLFDRFYRVPGQTKAGAGLGLSIAREIVLTHGGRIGVRDAPDHGSEFFFALPAEAVSTSAAVPHHEAAP
ncbi:MAG TPA: ATP-binding protein [Verrucomicrobiae bacterium]|nr:ATP-binding protein [Verrucomicrobiae bacterium]